MHPLFLSISVTLCYSSSYLIFPLIPLYTLRFVPFTWNVDESDEIKGFTEEDRKRFDELMNRFENEEEAIKNGTFSGFTESEVYFMGDINIGKFGNKYPGLGWYYMTD